MSKCDRCLHTVKTKTYKSVIRLVDPDGKKIGRKLCDGCAKAEGRK